MRKIVLCALIALFTSLSLKASTFSVSGYVHDNDGKPVSGVKITDGYRFVTTDAEGHYAIDVHDDALFVYLTIPAGYETESRNGAPLFYRELDRSAESQNADFDLVRTGEDETRHQFVVWADVQVYREKEIDLVKQAAADARELAENYDNPTFGMSCGDIVGEWASGMSVDVQKATAQSGFPFFTLMGNHDYRSDATNNEDSKTAYQRLYGPTYYSFDKGNVHYVVLDDVFNYVRHYVGYIEKRQLDWLKADLESVPTGSLVVVFTHIPTYSSWAVRDQKNKEEFNNIVTNRNALYAILDPYNAHICSAHKHHIENYVINDHLMEHNHAPLSGLFWQSLLCWDGTPWGYYVYEVDGSDIKWYFKAVGQSRDLQFKAYRVGEDTRKMDCVVANVWNWDPSWKVEWSENGKSMGEMTRYDGYDESIVRDVDNRREKEFTWQYIGAGETEHLFCAKPHSADSRIEITVTDRFGKEYKWNNQTDIYKTSAYSWSSSEIRNGNTIAGTPKVEAHPEYGTFVGTNALETSLYNLAVDEMVQDKEKDGTFRTGELWGGVWTRDVSYSAILALAHLEPEYVKTSLMRKVDRKKRIIQDTGTGGSWPCSTDRVIWAVAAWEVYLQTGELNWLRQVYHIINRSLDADRVSVYNPASGLYRGESSFIDWRVQSYPVWMQPVDIAMSECLGTNAVFYRALEVAGKMAAVLGRNADVRKYEEQAASLKEAINRNFWLSEEGYYANFIYGRNARILSRRSETLGESLCILWDIASEQQAASIMERMPLSVYGPTIFSPSIRAIATPYHNNGIWPFVTSFYGEAAAKTGNRAALLHALGSNARAAAVFGSNMENMVATTGSKSTALNSPRQLWSVAGYMGLYHRTLLGMEYTETGIAFHPCVPASMGGLRTLSGVRYRGMTLNVKVCGEGSIIHHFRLDGQETEPFVSADLTGEHTVEIVLTSDYYAAADKINVCPVVFDIDYPRVSLSDGALSWNAVEGAQSYRILRNGEFHAQTAECSYPLEGAEGEFAVIAISADRVQSFMSEPVRVNPNEKSFDCETALGTKRGSQLKTSVEVPKMGVYYIDFNYSNGNGTIEGYNKCATRTLYIDGKKIGIVVLPQRGDSWEETGWTNSVEVELTSGSHTFELRLLEENTNMNIDVDAANVHSLRMTYKNQK